MRHGSSDYSFPDKQHYVRIDKELIALKLIWFQKKDSKISMYSIYCLLNLLRFSYMKKKSQWIESISAIKEYRECENGGVFTL